MNNEKDKLATPAIEKWKIGVPALLALLSISFNLFQYFDIRGVKNERDKIGIRLDSLKLKSDFFKIKSDSIQFAMNEFTLKQKYPSFEVSYFQMSTVTFNSLKNRQSQAQQTNGLHQDHPLITAKYLSNGLQTGDAQYIMVLMIKQVGGSTANEVRIDVLENNLTSTSGFSFQSDIIDKFRNDINTIDTQLEIGQLAANNSVIIPLFIFDENPRGSGDSYSMKHKVYIPKQINYTTVDGKNLNQPVRQMLKNPFSITVDFDERG